MNTFGRRAVTVTVPDNKTVGAGEVENHQVLKGGRVGTRVPDGVSQLKNEAGRREGGIIVVATVPLLRAHQC